MSADSHAKKSSHTDRLNTFIDTLIGNPFERVARPSQEHSKINLSEKMHAPRRTKREQVGHVLRNGKESRKEFEIFVVDQLLSEIQEQDTVE